MRDPSMRTWCAATALALVAALAPVRASADGVVLVYDASGSMRETLPDGRARVAVARRAVSDVLSSWRSGSPLGLVAYGHRTDACDDVEVVIPPGPIDPERAAEAVRQLIPSGRTPLLAAIETAAQALSGIDGRRSVVAVTDGGETCRADPCGEARRVARHYGVRIHVIAFDMRPEESDVVACIAREADGVFLSANDTRTLSDALAGALSQTGLAGAVWQARLRAEQATRFLEAGDAELERLARDREAAIAQFTILRDMSGGVLDQLEESAPLWARLEEMAADFAEGERAARDRALSSGDPRWQELARMWAERSRSVRELMDEVRTERVRARSLFTRVDEDAFVIGQLIALGMADDAIAILRRTRDEVAAVNGSLENVFDEVDGLLGEAGVTP